MIKIINISNDFKIGEKIKITRKNREDEHLGSQILDIIDKNTIVISGPIKKNNLVFIHKEDLINLYYTVKDKGIFFYTAKVISREISPIYKLKVERISDITKIQKREHFRLLVGLKLEKEHYIYIKGERQAYMENCEAKDISGGGMRIYCNFKHRLGDEIYCRIKIKDEEININGVVKRIEEVDAFDFKYSLGVSFIEIEELSRDTIIRYIFDQQRILRNKGLI